MSAAARGRAALRRSGAAGGGRRAVPAPAWVEGWRSGGTGWLQPPRRRCGRRSTLPLEVGACAFGHQDGSDFEGGSEGRPGATGGGHGGRCAFVRSHDQRPLRRNPASGEAEGRPGLWLVKYNLSLVPWPTASHRGPHQGQPGKERELRFLKNVTVTLSLSKGDSDR